MTAAPVRKKPADLVDARAVVHDRNQLLSPWPSPAERSYKHGYDITTFPTNNRRTP